MQFLDQCKIFLSSGQGGDGCVSFRREKFVQYGGPDGGDGGRGGHIYVECIEGLNTLIDFRYRQHFKAGRGHHGMGTNRTGAAAEDIIIHVPAGTQILTDDREHVIADLTMPGERIRLLRGGDGGQGNTHFKSSTTRAPRRFTKGHPGEEMWVWLRLKLIADAGLLGLPNAGKSTFINAVTNTKAKVGAYPFTTLKPQLGLLEHKREAFVIADIPGLIAGAAEGVGIGDRFLGHIERCRVLVHLVDITADSPTASYRTVRHEIEAYGAGLEDKLELVALNKVDLVDAATASRRQKAMSRAIGKPVHLVSGATSQGISGLLDQLIEWLGKTPVESGADVEEEAAGEAAVEAPWSPI